MEQVSKGFFERMKKIQAIRMLGTGLDAGEMQEYVHEICFMLLLKIFRREITENPRHRCRRHLLRQRTEFCP